MSRSVANNQVNWKAAPEFSFTEHEIITKNGQRTDRTYRVLMIDGSPYNETIAIDGEPLSSAAQKREQAELQRVTAKRNAESPGARRQRIAKYERGRTQDHELMAEMIAAFDFRMGGVETVNGRECYRVNAYPKPGYVPNSRDTKVLSGMKGTLWIDTKEYQWVRVEASVFRPVSFGLFIAHVEPGTAFELDEAPVDSNIWEPTHFVTKVKASILHFWSHNSTDDESYSDYRREYPKQAGGGVLVAALRWNQCDAFSSLPLLPDTRFACSPKPGENSVFRSRWLPTAATCSTTRGETPLFRLSSTG
ncbi:MAG TPA: hypothetical protein VH640_26895 [Bryobacteraceae bacterium]